MESGTTTELNLADRMREQNIPYTPLKFQTSDQTFAAYLGDRCVAVTSDRSQLAGKRTSFPKPDAHTLLPVVMSKEPLTPATTNGDPAWADAVRWIVFGLMQAEEMRHHPGQRGRQGGRSQGQHQPGRPAPLPGGGG